MIIIKDRKEITESHLKSFWLYKNKTFLTKLCLRISMLSGQKGLDTGKFLYSNLVKYKYLIFFIFFIVVRLYLLTFNHGEFTDTYDILYRAKEIRHFQYSVFEQRMPGYPFLIALGMPFIDGILCAKILVMLASAGIFYLSFRIYNILFPKEKGGFLLLVLLLVNPFLLFWSIRPLTETIFLFFALLVFFIFYKKQTKYTNVSLGLTMGMAVMVRYEGYFLLPAIIIPLLIKKEWKRILVISSCFLLVIIPWLIRNKLLFGQFFSLQAHSLDRIRKFFLVELFASGKIHLPNQEQINYFITNFIETIFIMAFPIAFIWIFKGIISTLRDREKRLKIVSLLIFLILQSLLYLNSPAGSGKRLIIQVPFFLMFFVFGLQRPYAIRKGVVIISSIVLLAVFLVGINRYPSLIPNHYPKLFSILSTVTVVGFYCLFYFRNKEKYFRLVITVAIVCISILTSKVLKGRQYSYPTLIPAVQYAYSQLKGNIAFGCVSGLAMPKGITGWYLGEKGIPYPHGDKHGALVLTDEEQIKWLEANKIDYVMWHNERPKEGTKFTVLDNPQYSSKFLLLRAYGSISNATRIYKYGIPEEFYEVKEGRIDFKEQFTRKVINAYSPFSGRWKVYSMKIHMRPPVVDQIVEIYVNDYLIKTLKLYPKSYDYQIDHLDFPLMVTKNRTHSTPGVYPLAGVVEIKLESNIAINFDYIELEPEHIFTKFIGLYSRPMETFGYELFPFERIFNIANKKMVENNPREEFAQSSVVLPYYKNSPLTKAIGIISSTWWSRDIPQGTVIARMKVIDIEDNIYEFDIREGIDTAEVSYNENTKHNRAPQNKSGDYYTKFNFRKPIRLKEIQIDYVYLEGALKVQSLVLLKK